MDRRGVCVISIVCLLIAFVAAAAAGSDRKEAPSFDTGAANHRRTSATSSSVEDGIAGGRAPGALAERAGNERPKEDRYYNVGEDEDESEVDEDEDEPRAVAESHEAMSRDDARNSNASTAGSTGPRDRASAASKNFDSREVITVDASDEDVASNEAIVDELDDKYDKEVAELLEYKKERNVERRGGDVAKTKRVPTVKKELSTQREILIGGNETQVPKGLPPPRDPVNRVNEETDAVRRRRVDSSKAREDALADIFLKLLAKLVEDPDRWERVQKLLVNAEPNLSLDPPERSYAPTSTPFPATLESSGDARKPRRKSKKKKKKPRHGASTTASTPVPATPPFTTTTETAVQWRLVAERLFGQGQRHPLEESGRTATPQGSAGDSPSPKGGPKSKPTPSDKVRQLGNRRLPRLDRVEGRQPGRVEPRERYDRPADAERTPDYDVSESHHRRRYEEDYRGDSNVQSDGFPREQEFEPPARDFPASKSWPSLAYGYGPAWRTEERPVHRPAASENWPWRRPPSDAEYWPRRGFFPVEKNHWSTVNDEAVADRELEAEKMWQQRRGQHSWNEYRPTWSEEKPVKASWRQAERPAKLYDRERSDGVREKGKNRSDSSESPTKQEAKDSVVLPQISMRTWNSLTSDPATWPHKLPGAKPWPKDENGKSYNPNADLVKKLGLDKRAEDAWAERDAEKPNDEGKIKGGKDEGSFSSKEFAQGQEPPRAESLEYRSVDGKSNFSDHKTRSGDSAESWAVLADTKGRPDDRSKPRNLRGDWRREYEENDSWIGEAALPKIRSVGAWVMAADQATRKPYRIEPMEPSGDGPPGRWSESFGWPGKGSRSEKFNDSWMDRSDAPPWTDRANPAEIWPGKANGKSGSWFAKRKDPDGWPSKSANTESWKVKDDWPGKPESSSWTSKAEDNDSWPARAGYRSTKSNESWTFKTDEDAAAKYNGDAWPVRVKGEDPVDGWTRKTNDPSGWPSKGAELSPWQQKIGDEWSYGKSGSAGSWPGKWKQFAYHRVTALPISKPGTAADAASPKSRNAFVAVSAVSSPKYAGNEWRKLEEEGRPDEPERPVYAWKKDSGPRGNASGDPLESQLEALRRIDLWPYNENEAGKGVTPTSPAANATPSVPTNSTTAKTTSAAMAAHRGTGLSALANGDGPLVTSRRTISMK